VILLSCGSNLNPLFPVVGLCLSDFSR
jgi:hypothetical protein